MPDITISGQVISFPGVSASPNWAEAVIDFAEAVEDALSSVVGTFDVTPQQFSLTAVADGVATLVTNLSFSTTQVRSADITYAVYRTSSSGTFTETGKLYIVYDEDQTTNQKWQMTREGVSDASVDFTIDDTGQVYITTTSIGGTGYSGFVDYSAKTLQNSY